MRKCISEEYLTRERESMEVLTESKTIHFGIPNVAFTGGGGGAAAAIIISKWRHSPDYSNKD